jgi:hypothetical protein
MGLMLSDQCECWHFLYFTVDIESHGIVKFHWHELPVVGDARLALDHGQSGFQARFIKRLDFSTGKRE